MRYARPPSFRPLRAYAFNPESALDPAQAIDNQVSLKVPWEEDLQPGPVGEYVEVVDYDPGSECFYLPVDLNAPSVRGAKRSGSRPKAIPNFTSSWLCVGDVGGPTLRARSWPHGAFVAPDRRAGRKSVSHFSLSWC